MTSCDFGGQFTRLAADETRVDSPARKTVIANRFKAAGTNTIGETLCSSVTLARPTLVPSNAEEANSAAPHSVTAAWVPNTPSRVSG